MDIGALLSRTWDIVWNNKWLIVLGIVVALGGNVPSNFGSGGSGYQFNDGEQGYNYNYNPDFEYVPGETPFPEEEFGEALRAVLPFAGLAGAILIPLILIGVVIGVLVWFVQQIATGGLIDGVNKLDTGEATTLGDSVRAGWNRKWRLAGVGLVPAIPGLVVAVTALVLGATFLGVSGFGRGQFPSDIFSPGLGITLVAVLCVVGLISLALNILYTFASRALMTEDLGVFESYGRGWEVLRGHIGPALLIFIVQVLISIVIGILLFLPALCCLLWPFLLIINGGITTYFSGLWTLAWRDWTSAKVGSEPLPAM